MTTGDIRESLFQRLTNAPEEYDRAYFDRLIRQLELIFSLIQNPGHHRASTLTLTDLQHGGYNLAVGEVYYDGSGFLKIVREGDAIPLGLSGTGALGTVTIVTT